MKCIISVCVSRSNDVCSANGMSLGGGANCLSDGRWAECISVITVNIALLLVQLN